MLTKKKNSEISNVNNINISLPFTIILNNYTQESYNYPL